MAAPQFPALTGRVVDQAELLTALQEQRISEKLAAHQQQTSNQLVVVTLQSLQGYDIADYGYQLGRAWGIGQEDNNNGALLIIAPNERKVRIEAGYGLEGSLTDAMSHHIIQQDILPAFKQNNYPAGITAAVNSILKVMNNEYTNSTPPLNPQQQSTPEIIMPLIILAMIVLSEFFRARTAQKVLFSGVFGGIFGVVAWAISSSLLIAIGVGIGIFLLVFFSGGGGSSGRGGSGGYWGGTSGGRYGGGFGGGGFSGGGGSFGGGGASGSW